MSPAPQPNLTPPRAPIDWRALRLWQIQPLRDAAVILAVVGVLYVGKILSLVTVPLLLALLLAYLVEPVVQAVTARRWMSRQGAALGIILAFTLVVITPAIIGAVIGTIQGATFLHRFGNNVTILADAVAHPEKPRAREMLPNEGWRHLADSLVELRLEAERARAQERRPPTDAPPLSTQAQGGATAQDDAPGIPPPVATASEAPSDAGTLIGPAPQANPAAVQLYRAVEFAISWVKANANALGKTAISTGFTAIETVLRWISSLTMLIFGAFLTAFFFYFFCTGYGKVLEFWERLIPERRKGVAFALLKQMDAVISGFVRGRLTIAAILIGFYTLAYWLIGVPAPLILGPVVGALSLVPYAAGVGMPMAMLLLWVGPNLAGFQSEWWWIVFAPIGVSAISQVLDDYVLTPAIQGRNTGMDTPTILFASLAGAVLAGFYGLLVAIPVAACLKILLRETVWPRLREWAAGKATDPLPISQT